MLKKEPGVKVKILVVVNTYASSMETFIYNHIKSLCSSGLFSIEIACISYPENSFTIDDLIEVTVLDLSFKNRLLAALRTFLSNPIDFFKLLLIGGRVSKNLSVYEAYQKLRRKHVDLLHCHFGQNGNLIAPLIQSQIIKGKFVTQFHGLDITLPIVKEKGYYRTLKSCVDVALTNTKFSKGKLLGLGFKETQIKTIPVGTDGTTFEPGNFEKSPLFTIIFIGRLIELKGVRLLPDIDKGLRKSLGTDFDILVIGEGSLRSELEHYNTTCSESRISILGKKSVSEVVEILQRSSVLLYPGYKDHQGREETQGVIVQEAMFMGVPVIVTDVGGVAEAVEDGLSGFVIPPKNIGAMVDKLVYLYQNKETCNNMGKAGRRLAMKYYDLSVTNEILYNEVYFTS